MRLFGIKENLPLNFIICGQLVSKNDFLHMERTISENVLILVLEGCLNINSNNQNFSVSKNHFILLKAGEKHFGSQKSSGKLKYYWVHFSDFLYTLLPEDDKSSFSYLIPESGTFEENSRLLPLFRQMMDFSLDNNLLNKQIINYSLSVFLMEFSNNFLFGSQKKLKNNPVINEICTWIKENYQNNFSIEELAKEFNYQSSYLSNLFRKSINMSIIQYTNNIRIAAAKNLLQNFSIKETAYSCGFDDEKYFMKVFKKHEGITPTQYKLAFNKKYTNS